MFIRFNQSWQAERLGIFETEVLSESELITGGLTWTLEKTDVAVEDQIPKPIPRSDEESEMTYFSHVLGEVVPHYAKTLKQEQECDMSFSHGFYSAWKNSKTTYCKPINNNPKNSRVDCYRYQQPRHSGFDIFCSMNNVLIDFSQVTNMTDQCNEEWGVDGCKRYYDFPHGSIQGTCEKEPQFSTTERWPTGHFQQLNRPFFNGFESLNDLESIGSVEDIVTVNNPVLLVARDGAFNTYHSMEDYINAFLVLESLQINPKEEKLDVLIMDQDVNGPYVPMFEKAFSYRNNNFKTRIITKHWVPKGKKVFFKNVIVNMPGVSSPIVKDMSAISPCSPASDLFVTFGRHILKLVYKFQNIPQHQSLNQHSQTVTHSIST